MAYKKVILIALHAALTNEPPKQPKQPLTFKQKIAELRRRKSNKKPPQK